MTSVHATIIIKPIDFVLKINFKTMSKGVHVFELCSVNKVV